MYRSQTVSHDGATWRIDEGDSFGDVLDWIESTPRAWKHGYYASEVIEGTRDDTPKKWYGTHDFPEAMKLARYGWEAGRKELKVGLDTANVLRRTLAHKSEGLDVAGAYPFVPAAVAGDPLCMFTVGQDMIKTKPVVRIIVNTTWSHNIGRKIIMNRGAAILSWVDALEAQAIRCEIYCSYIAERYGSTPSHCSLGFYAKRAEEHLDIDRLAFTLVHPSILRRIGFAIAERHKDMEDTGWASGYGSPTNAIPPTLDIPHSVYFPALTYGEGDWASPATAVAAVERAILKSLQHSEVEEDLKSMEG